MVKVATQEVKVTSPKVTVTIPKVKVSKPKVKITIPKVQVSKPKVKITTLEVKIKIKITISKVKITTQKVQVTRLQVQVPVQVTSPQVKVTRSQVGITQCSSDRGFGYNRGIRGSEDITSKVQFTKNTQIIKKIKIKIQGKGKWITGKFKPLFNSMLICFPRECILQNIVKIAVDPLPGKIQTKLKCIKISDA